MNAELLKSKMDIFFKKVSPEYLIDEFEKMGYTFIDANVCWKTPNPYYYIVQSYTEEEAGFFQKFFQRKKDHVKKLTSEYPGSFFCLKIAA